MSVCTKMLSNDKKSTGQSDELFSSCNTTGLNPNKSLVSSSGERERERFDRQ